MQQNFAIPTLEALDAAVAEIMQHTENKVYYLEGPLGAGKTAFVRSWLCQAGYQGAVQSPTYALMHEYYIGQHAVIHADLYRLTVPDELLYLDVRDWEARVSHIFIEWAQNGGDLLPPPDAICQFSGHGDCRILSLTRRKC